MGAGQQMLLGTAPAAAGGAGQVVFTTAGAGSWTVPAGVTSVCVVCVGPGGTGSSGTGGGGGALAYGNNIAVTPGASVNYNVGVVDTSDTWFSSSTALVGGRGGNAAANGTAGVSSGTLRNGGGNGGQGGLSAGAGGAGGYSGNGQNGQGTANGTAAATGGAGGAGARTNYGGGGVGLLGEGTSAPQAADFAPGNGGSGGAAGSGSSGGAYGGGSAGGTPGGGAIRIIWGAGRSYPSTNTADA